jgi:hypothetical protein
VGELMLQGVEVSHGDAQLQVVVCIGLRGHHICAQQRSKPIHKTKCFAPLLCTSDIARV